MRSRFLFILAILALIIAVACGGGTNSSMSRSTGTVPATRSVTQVTIGDDPGDRVASLSITISSISLISDSNVSVPLLSTPATVEISSLAGTTTPLATVAVPAGQYLKATIALSNATMTIIDPPATTVKTIGASPALPFTINLNPPFVSDGTARVINIDFDLHASVTVDSTGALTLNPVFLIKHDRMLGPPMSGMLNPFTGGVDQTLGMVTAVNGSSFTITTAMGQRSLTFATNASTVFKNVSGISGLQSGMLVFVQGQAQADGSLLASTVGLLANGLRNASGAIGIVVATSGTPATSMSLLAHGLNTPTPMAMPIGGVLVNLGTGTAFRTDSDGVDMTGLNLTFDATTLSPAQMVEVDAMASTSTPTGSTQPVVAALNATQVQLEQQPLFGTISNLAADSFTLTVPSDSFFATIAKTTTITVYKQAGTQVATGATLANGQKVVVRGLLFNNGAYKMVATRIATLPS